MTIKHFKNNKNNKLFNIILQFRLSFFSINRTYTLFCCLNCSRQFCPQVRGTRFVYLALCWTYRLYDREFLFLVLMNSWSMALLAMVSVGQLRFIKRPLFELELSFHLGAFELQINLELISFWNIQKVESFLLPWCLNILK